MVQTTTTHEVVETRVCPGCGQERPYEEVKAYAVIYGSDYRVRFSRLAETTESHMKIRATSRSDLPPVTDEWIGIQALLTLVDIENPEDIVAAVQHRQMEESCDACQGRGYVWVRTGPTDAEQEPCEKCDAFESRRAAAVTTEAF